MSSCGQEIVAWIDFRIEGERSEVDNKKEDDPDPQEDVPLGDRCGPLTGGGLRCLRGRGRFLFVDAQPCGP
jgi:hypothetical protein